jgi:hypothetical protein
MRKKYYIVNVPPWGKVYYIVILQGVNLLWGKVYSMTLVLICFPHLKYLLLIIGPPRYIFIIIVFAVLLLNKV